MTDGASIAQFFRVREPATPDDVEADLWNAAVGPMQYHEPNVAYQEAILEQYKLYVEMADRISVRRGLANTFFLTLNAAVFTLIGVFWKDRPQAAPTVLIVPFFIAVALCLAWFWLVRSYRQLNSGKSAVIGALERRLPASPYWAAEWTALGKGNDRARYWSLTHIEIWVPALFGLAYFAALLGALVL